MKTLRFSVPAVAALLFAGCNPAVNDNSSAVLLFSEFAIDEGTGASGFYSDVVEASGQPADQFADIKVSSEPKSPDATLSPLYTVDYQSYTAVFTRPDGKNEPGVNVPFPFTLALNGSVAPGGSTNTEIVLVTEEQKRAAPLRNLWYSENQRIFATITVTVYGRDRVENNVSTATSAPIIFGDF